MTRVTLRRMLPSLLFFLAIATYLAWFLWDVVAQSTRPANLILVVPVGIVALLLTFVVLAEEIVKAVRAAAAAAGRPRLRIDWRIFGTMALLGAFVAVTMTVGLFDVATFVYLMASLFVLGERRLPWLIGFPLVFTIVTIGGLKMMLSYDMTTLIL